MGIRIPFKWEGKPDPLANAGKFDVAEVVALPPDGWGAPTNVRDTRDQISRRALDATDGTAAAREWAAAKAETALKNWERGVSSGRIKPTT